ncbi:MAG: alpha/beta hydrolase [Jatrophihabitans sp.]
MRRWLRLVLLPLVAFLVAALFAVPAGAQPVQPAFTDAGGIHVVSAQQVDDRLWSLSVSTPALGRAVRVRVLLPTGYADNPEQRYPVLYLFHGTSGGPDDWLNQGDAAQTTAGRPLVVVMPDAGFDNDGGSWFTNWYDTHTALGPSQWETFHIDQLIPWVDANIRTVADRSGRAIAGLSQGGFGAMSYAARHPDMFAAAASFSGAPDIDRDPVVVPVSTGVIEGTAAYLDGVEPVAMFGPRLTNEINWSAHDPATLSTNLRGTSLFMWTATGLPGPYDTAPNPTASAIEAITHLSTVLFHEHLQQEGIPSYYDDYVLGTHIFPYWARDLREFVGPLMDVFAHPSTPTTISYRSTDATWHQWGWSVTDQRAVRQAFTGIADANAGGFTLTGLGSADVTTPAFYLPGSVHQVTLRGATGATVSFASADGAGRLRLQVPLTSALTLGPGTSTVTIG